MTFTVFEGHVLALLLCLSIIAVLIAAKLYERNR